MVRFLLPLIFTVFIESSSAMADTPLSPVPPKPLANYQVDVLPANIASTATTQPKENIQVFGEPRNSAGHPCTLLDKEDVADLKKALTTNPDAQKAFAALKTVCDTRIAKPLDVPVPQKAPDGSWMFPGDFPDNVPPYKKVSHTNEPNATSMANLGMMYQLTGDEKYADFCKKMLLAYADGYNSYGHPTGWTEKSYRSAVDGRLTGQFLEDGFWLCNAAYAYDMVYELPSWTPAERAHVHDDLLKPVAAEFYAPILGKMDYLSSTHNRSAICTAGTLMAGYATEDPDLVNKALYGNGGTKEAPTGGLLQVHFGECLMPDGLWIEGSPAYQLSIASAGLFDDAEVLWHHGIDLYRYRGGVLKRLLDSTIALAYPNPKMTTARLHDSGSVSLLDDRDWENNEVGVPYECGYRRYQDPAYIPVIRNATKTLSPTIHSGPVSLFLDLPPADTVPPQPIVNANFYSVGYGVQRLPTANGTNQLIMEYGPSAGHAHPSKLGIDLYALGDPVMVFPGVIFPYNDPMDPKWYWTTLGNCAMEVDEQPQIYSGNRWKFPKTLPDPIATQVVYGPASTMGIHRAWSNTIYPGVTQDRALFLTPEYLADIFGGFSDAPHKYDLAWHIRGKMSTTLKTDPFQFPDPVAAGYNAMSNVTHTNTDQPWTATIETLNNQTVRFLAAGGNPTDLYLGTGRYTIGKGLDEEPPMIIQRRADKNSALFGNVADISGDKNGYVKSVAQEGSLDLGYGLLKVETVKGNDLCFASYRPGNYKAGGLDTDALQAMVRMDGTNVEALYLGGGKSLKAAGGAIQRSDAGLAYVEKTPTGTYIVGNPSPIAATVTVTLPALSNLNAFNLDEQDKRSGPAQVTPGATAGSFTLQLKPAAKVEFTSK